MNNDRETWKIVATVVGLMLAAFLISILLGWTSRKPQYREARYIVEAGDTLDGLYYRYGGGDYHRWRYEVKERNGMEDSGLLAGDEIVILVEDKGGILTWE